MLRVLIVEDHEMVAEGLSAALSAESDLEVVGQVATVADALEATGELEPDVVLADYQLPDGTGADVARQVHEHVADVPVVMLTGAGHDEIVAEAVQSGCAGFLDKSRPVRDVAAAVRAVADGEAFFDPRELASALDRVRHPRRAGSAELTPREHEVLGLLAHGLGTREIAERLYLSHHTVRNHVRNVLAKLGAHSKLEAVTIAAREGIVSVG